MTSRLFSEKSPAAEALRILLLTSATLWLAYPFFADRLVGTGDSLWYGNMLADTVTQARAGVWPVWIGQSDFAFNGVIYPHRAAPYYHHLGILLDSLTFRSLGFYRLQHLTFVVSLVGGALSCYCCLARLGVARRWEAFFFSLLYVACPGVVGLVYTQDLYMSAMTLPWVPLVFYGAAQSFDDRGPKPLGALAAGLGALWWAHAPIALWTTLLAGATQLMRLRTLTVKNAFGAAALFLLLAGYPLVSVWKLHAPGDALVPYAFDRARIVAAIRENFPADLLPLGNASAPLADLQLGYALWLVLVFATVVALWKRHRAALILLTAATTLLVLLFPVPGNAWLWLHLPETLVSITFYWPMQRFYVLVAALVVVAAQLSMCALPDHSGWRRRAALTALALPCGWSFFEADKFLHRAAQTAAVVADTSILLRPESSNLMRHSYGLYAGMPSSFTYGTMDPAMESRLLDAAGTHLVATNFDLPAGTPIRATFSGMIDANPGILNLTPEFTLQPGVRYLLTFDFIKPAAHGVLQIAGLNFFREYLLPTADGASGFGAGQSNRPALTVWTTRHQPEKVHLRFIPTDPGAVPRDFIPFARYRFEALDPARLPVELHSLVPFYVATVRATEPGFVETPRMFLPGYAAQVDGRPAEVKKSREGLVMIPIAAGAHRVELRFSPPLPVRLAYWASVIAWLGLIGFTVACRLRPARAA